jgi:hypothetical protein
MYIIVWKHNTREPHVDVDTHGFIIQHYTYEEARQSAEETYKTENEFKKSEWYFNYKIYELKE